MPYVTQANLEALFTPDQVRRAFTDDGATINTARLEFALDAATADADAILSLAWSDPVQRALVAADKGVMRHIATIAMHYGLQRPEYISDARPTGMMGPAADEARKALRAISQGKLRPDVAAGAGANANVTGRLSAPVEPRYVFAASRRRPNTGGY